MIRFVRFRVDNPPLEVMIAFLTGYFTFLPTSAIGASGVLAVVTESIRGQYRFRRDRFSARFDESDDGGIEERSQAYQRVRRELLHAERHALHELRNEGKISDEVMQRVERDLDLEDSRLDV